MSDFTDQLSEVLAIDPSTTALSAGNRDFSWGEFAGAVGSIRAQLDRFNLPADTRIGIMLRNRPGHVAAIAAVLAGKYCLVTLNAMLPDQALAADIDALDLPVIIGSDSDLSRVGVDSAWIRIRDDLGGVETFGGAVTAQDITAPGVAIEMLTSGTTGRPKRIPLARRAFEASFVGFKAYEGGRSTDEAPRLRSGTVMVVNPLTHIGGIYGCIGALVAGRKIALLERFSVDTWAAAVERHQLKVAPAVPAAIKMILEANVPAERLASLTTIISGTAPLDPAVVDAFFSRYGIPVLSNYGATEFAGAVAGWTLRDFQQHWAGKRGSVGRLHTNIEARVVNAETGAVQPVGAEGLLELRGPQLGDQPDWLRTTDRAMIDADNFLFIRGRADNAIVRGGFKVHPDDVVAALHEHPAIREAAVIGLPDARLGMVPVAALILRQRAPRPDDDELRRHLRDRLLPYQVPTRFRIVDDFPRTPSMKPSTLALKALFEQEDFDAD